MKDDRDGGDVDGRRMARVQNGISKQQTQWAWAWHRMRIKNVGGKRQKVAHLLRMAGSVWLMGTCGMWVCMGNENIKKYPLFAIATPTHTYEP